MIKKILFVLLFLSLTNTQLNSDSKINSIIEGSADAKVKLIVDTYETLEKELSSGNIDKKDFVK